MTRGGRPCLSDFGIAGAFIDHPFHKFKLETVRYVAPEWIHRDADPPGKEGDVYSLAMTSFTVCFCPVVIQSNTQNNPHTLLSGTHGGVAI